MNEDYEELTARFVSTNEDGAELFNSGAFALWDAARHMGEHRGWMRINEEILANNAAVLENNRLVLAATERQNELLAALLQEMKGK